MDGVAGAAPDGGHEPIDTAERLDNGVDRCGHLIALGDVGGSGDRGVTELVGQRPRPIGVASDDPDLAADADECS